MCLSAGTSLGGWEDATGAETGPGGLSAVEAGTVRAAAWPGFEGGGDCSIAQVVSHPPRRREERQE